MSASPGSGKEAASPPLTFKEGCRTRAGDAPRKDTAPASLSLTDPAAHPKMTQQPQGGP